MDNILTATKIAAKCIVGASDERLKDIGTPLRGDWLARLRKLEGVLFKWKESGNADVGIIAQKLEELAKGTELEGMLVEELDGFKHVRFNSLQTVVLRAFQELAGDVEGDSHLMREQAEEIEIKWRRIACWIPS